MIPADSVLKKDEENKRKETKVHQVRVDKQTNIKYPKWQDRLLPVMVGVLIVLMVFFFVSTYLQLSFLHRTILEMPVVDLQRSSETSLVSGTETFQDQLSARELELRGEMEAYIVMQRYRMASILLMANLWIRYLGFATGMILALVGASFVLGKLREPRQKIEGKISMVDLSLRTTSPGIILVILGVVLMFTTLVNVDSYDVKDGNIYLSPPITIPTPQDFTLETLPPQGSLFDNLTPQPTESSPSDNP